MTALERWLCACQGTYFLVSGVWPLISISTFQAVTGPKTDLWLVKTVGLLITLLALVMLTSALRGRATSEARVAALGSALVLAAVDVVYSLGGVISKIYLADALAECVFALTWTAVLLRARTSNAAETRAPE